MWVEFYSHLPAYEDGTECSETSAYKLQTSGNYPKENIQHTEHGECLKSRNEIHCGSFHCKGQVLCTKEQVSFGNTTLRPVPTDSQKVKANCQLEVRRIPVEVSFWMLLQSYRHLITQTVKSFTDIWSDRLPYIKFYVLLTVRLYIIL